MNTDMFCKSSKHFGFCFMNKNTCAIFREKLEMGPEKLKILKRKGQQPTITTVKPNYNATRFYLAFSIQYFVSFFVFVKTTSIQ